MTHTENLADFLCRRLFEAGCHQAFGVPGDFNLAFLDQLVKSKVEYIGCCNELNAAYAADGYARITGIGACITTYAVGELSALNGIAGAFAECVPVVKISGCPAREYYKNRPLLHHTLGDYMTPYHIYQRVTVDQCILNDAKTAGKEIDRVLKHCLMFKQPVYICIPSDMVNEEIEVEDGPFQIPTDPVSDPEALEEAVNEIVDMVKAAKRPLFIPGVEIIRRRYNDLFEQITNKTNIPYCTMLLSKGLLSEDHPHFMGLYMGARSRPAIIECVKESDALIILGERLTDFNTGGFSQTFNDRSRVQVNYDNIKIRAHSYTRVYLKDVMEKLLERLPVFNDPPYDYPVAKRTCVNRPDKTLPYSLEDKLTMKKVFNCFSKRLQPNQVLITETGASMFAGAETMLPHGATYICQTFYGSIGYTVGACFGASLAMNRLGRKERVVLLVGDGSFQLTCQEVSSMIRYKLNPLILLVNNDGYLIERVITDNCYNDIHMWKYADLPKVFNAPDECCFKCEKMEDIHKAFEYAEKNPDQFMFVEAIFDKWDCNVLLKSAGRSMALNNKLTPSITEDMLNESIESLPPA